MDQELERIADLVAARIRAQLSAGATPGADEPCINDCTACGQCVTKRPHSVQALRSQGAARLAAGPGIEGTVARDLAGMIDHTLLKPEATREELEQLCREASKHAFASVCVNSCNVKRVRALITNSAVKICAVVGFPLGAMAPGAKAYEAREAVRDGASEIDMVINIGALKDGDYVLVADDIRRGVEASRPALVKVIIEAALLSDEEKVAACTLSKIAGAHFVKTSTGFSKGGATEADVALMRRVVGAEMGVKASGGVRSQDDAKKMIAAGATRIGASASVAIVTGGRSNAQY